MTHEEILTTLGNYVDYLIAGSSAEAPLWNIEKVRSGKPNKWNYVDGCMITACLSLYKTTGDEKFLKFSRDFVDYFVKDGDEIYTVVLNSTTTDQRFTDTATLANWYYGHKVTVAIANTQEKTANGNPLMARIGQTDWTDKTIDATLADPTAQATVFSLAGEVTEKVSYDDLSGTVHVGDKVGSVTLKQDGTKIAVMDLVADEEGAGPNPIEWLLVKLDRLGRRIDNRPLTAESETVAKAPEV